MMACRRRTKGTMGLQKLLYSNRNHGYREQQVIKQKNNDYMTMIIQYKNPHKTMF